MRKLLLILAMAPLFGGCGTLDFGGIDEKPFEFRLGWDKGIQPIGQEDPNNPGYDMDGNLIPSDEVKATYAFPDVSAGMAYVFSEDNARATPTLGVEMFEVKVPYLRWLKCDVGAGHNYPYVYLGKRITSVYEISAGVMFGYDLSDNDSGDDEAWTVGGQITLIKF